MRVIRYHWRRITGTAALLVVLESEGAIHWLILGVLLYLWDAVRVPPPPVVWVHDPYFDDPHYA